MFFVYLLKSLKDGKYYIGQTENLKKRLKEHNSGKNKSTKSRVPFVLLGFEEYNKREESRFREYQLKKYPRKKKEFIDKLINENN
jgi:putative endonuclease